MSAAMRDPSFLAVATAAVWLTLLQATQLPDEEVRTEEKVQTSERQEHLHFIDVRIDPETLCFRDIRLDAFGWIVSLTYVEPEEEAPASGIRFERRRVPRAIPERIRSRYGPDESDGLAHLLEQRLIAFLRESWSKHADEVVSVLRYETDPFSAFKQIRDRVGSSAIQYLRSVNGTSSGDPDGASLISRSTETGPYVLTTSGHYAWLRMRSRIVRNRSELARILAAYPAASVREAA